MSKIFTGCCAVGVAFMVTSCASKPWGDPLEEEPLAQTRQLVDSMKRRDLQCGQTLHADMAIFYKDPVSQTALKGYLEFSFPQSFKFVVSNPFGQPLFVATGSKNVFSSLDTSKRQYLAGSLTAFALRHSLPVEFMTGDWGEWLTARTLFAGSAVIAAMPDRNQRGVWLTIRNYGEGLETYSHLLLNQEEKRYEELILENKEGKTLAQINYANWQNLGKCQQPQSINVENLGYGTTIQMQLSEIELTSEPNEYRLHPPSDYFIQFLP